MGNDKNKVIVVSNYNDSRWIPTHKGNPLVYSTDTVLKYWPVGLL